jgi:hypothetical protein
MALGTEVVDLGPGMDLVAAELGTGMDLCSVTEMVMGTSLIGPRLCGVAVAVM